MSVTIVPCNSLCLNMGDVAMLQVAVSRLRALWPWEDLRVFTSDAGALLRYCPGVTPVCLPDQPEWCTDRYLGGRLHSWLPEPHSDRLADLYVGLAARAPMVRETLLRLRSALQRDQRQSFRTFVDTIAGSRLVIISGAGGVADHFHAYSNLVLLALQCAQARGIPTAIVGHGFGPLTAPDLLRKAAAILPGVDLIALREERASVPLLISLGVPLGHVVTTGDDAVELAYEARPARMGRGVGINLRLARSAAATEHDIDIVREGLRQFASEWLAPHVPLPIARQRDLDLNVIRQLTTQSEGMSDGRDLDTPLKVIHQVGRCRIVVTGAYHAAVFALSQGVPAVCLARSPYFIGKFRGLADQFEAGCYLVSLDDEDVPGRLAETMRQAWDEAPRVHEWLCEAAAQQVARGQALYRQLQSLVEQSDRRRRSPAA